MLLLLVAASCRVAAHIFHVVSGMTALACAAAAIACAAARTAGSRADALRLTHADGSARCFGDVFRTQAAQRDGVVDDIGGNG